VPVKVKICGICSVEDARAAVAAGADFLGLNFHPASPRCVDPAVARDIAAALAGTPLVGVFVDAPRERVEALAAELGLAALQFHGDEDPAYCSGWDRRVIKAIRPRPGEKAADLAGPYATDYLLLDAWVAGAHGGTGVPVDVDAARGLDAGRLFVAGGLRPETVVAVVERLRPFAVDVASGVEERPGKKDHAKLEAFIRRAKAA
jgi:phosphoribosylanthranilate isomerase